MAERVIQDIRVTEKWAQVKYGFRKGRSHKTNSITVFDKGISLLGKTDVLVFKKKKSIAYVPNRKKNRERKEKRKIKKKYYDGGVRN